METIYSEQTNTSEIANLVKETNLQHVAIIMDGNGRWAKNKGLPSASGTKKELIL